MLLPVAVNIKILMDVALSRNNSDQILILEFSLFLVFYRLIMVI